jgi:pimeloyl-ACP methyl ester carboxylesterase
VAISDSLGQIRTADLAGSRIAYRERGEGPPVVFIHGLLVNADLWRNVVPAVADAGYRCIAPDWPFGSHQIPIGPSTDLSPIGASDLIREFLDHLSLEEVTLVANDTGGALAQVLISRHPDRIARVVLTPSDCFERFFPPVFRPLQWLSRIGGSGWLIAQLLRPRALHRLPITFGWVAKRPIPPEIVDSYLLPCRHSRPIQRDLRRFIRGVDNKVTIAAARDLPHFAGPVLLAWAVDDRLFPIALADRLARLFPRARVARIADSYTFVSEDQPAILSGLIIQFLHESSGGPQ